MGGFALGFGVAVKPVQAPLLLLSVWGRRFKTAGAAAFTVVVLGRLPPRSTCPNTC